MSESERSNASGNDIEKALSKKNVLNRFSVLLKRDSGVWFLQTTEPAILTVFESTVHITKSSGDSFSASGPIYISLKNITVEAPSRDNREIRLTEDNKKGTRDAVSVTFLCLALPRPKVLSAIFRARARKRWSLRKKPTFDEDSFRTWNISQVKRSTGAVVNRSFRIIPGTVDVCAENADHSGPISVYSIADITSILYSPEDEEATILFNKNRNYRIWRGSHVWAFLMAIQERSQLKLSCEIKFVQCSKEQLREKRRELDFSILLGKDINTLESLCCITATRVREMKGKENKNVILQIGFDFVVERHAENLSVITVFSPVEILRVQRRCDDEHGLCMEFFEMEFADGRTRTYESRDASIFLATLFYVRERNGRGNQNKRSKLDLFIRSNKETVSDEEMRIILEKEGSFRNGDNVPVISEQIRALSHDVDINVANVLESIHQGLHTLRSGNDQSLTNFYIKARELLVALERFNFLVPPGMHQNMSGKSLLGLYLLVEKIHSRITEKTSEVQSTSKHSANGLDYDSVISTIATPLLETYARSITDPTVLENSLRRTDICKLAIGFAEIHNPSISLAAIHLISAFCSPVESMDISSKPELKHAFEFYGSQVPKLLKVLREHTHRYEFYFAGEVLNIVAKILRYYKQYDSDNLDKFILKLAPFWNEFYMLSRTKSPNLSLAATQVLKDICDVAHSIQWPLRNQLEYDMSRPEDEISSKPVVRHPKVTALLRAKGGLLWHLLFALNTTTARDAVSTSETFMAPLDSEMYFEQEKASGSLFDSIVADDTRTAEMVRRIFPGEIIMRSKGEDINLPSNSYAKTNINAKKCIEMIRKDIYDPEIIWNEKTRSYLHQSIIEQLKEIKQDRWFSKYPDNDNSHSSNVWDDFHFSIDYSQVLYHEIPLGAYLYARPLTDTDLCPHWSLRNPPSSFHMAFLSFSGSQSIHFRLHALMGVKAILNRHLYEIPELFYFVEVFLSFLLGHEQITWRERSLISEILWICSRDEKSMRVLTTRDNILRLASILSISCATESLYETTEEHSRNLMYSPDTISLPHGNKPGGMDLVYSRITSQFVLHIFFSMSTFSTSDDFAIECLRESEEGAQESTNPSIIERNLISRETFCSMAQALLSDDDTVFQYTLLILHRIIPLLTVDVILQSGVCLFILQRNTNAHLMTSSWLLRRCLEKDETLLDHLLPQHLVSLLKTEGPRKFSQIYSSEVLQPDLIWSSECRKCLSNAIKERLDGFIQERKKDPFLIFSNSPEFWEPKLSVDFPGISSRLLCDGLFVDVLSREEFCNTFPIENPIIMIQDSFTLLDGQRTFEETLSLLRLQLKMAFRFGPHILKRHPGDQSFTSLGTYIRMLSSYLQDSTGFDPEMFEVIKILLHLIEISISRKEQSTYKSDSEEASEDDFDGHAIKNEKYGGQLSVEKTEIPQKSTPIYLTNKETETPLEVFDNCDGIYSIDTALVVMLTDRSSPFFQYFKKTGRMKLQTSPKSMQMERRVSNNPTRKINSMNELFEYKKSCFNIVTIYLRDTQNRREISSCLSTIDSAMLTLWKLGNHTYETEFDPVQIEAARSCFELLSLVCSNEYMDIVRYAFDNGLLMCLIQLCLNYGKQWRHDTGMNRPNRSTKPNINDGNHQHPMSKITKNWISLSAAYILGRLMHLDDANVTYRMDQILGGITGFFSKEFFRAHYCSLWNLDEVPKNDCAQSFLEALHGDFAQPNLIWNTETRHELSMLCTDVSENFCNLPFDRKSKSFALAGMFSSFQYACHSKEIIAHGIFLLLYIDCKDWMHPEPASFFMKLLQELNEISTANEHGDFLISKDSGVSHKAEVILESISTLLDRQNGCIDGLVKKDLIGTPFLTLRNGIGLVREKSIEIIKKFAQQPNILPILSDRKFVFALYETSFAGVERQFRENSLRLTSYISMISPDFSDQLLSIGFLISLIRLIAEDSPRKTVLRTVSLEGIAALMKHDSLRTRTAKSIRNILPGKLAEVMCQYFAHENNEASFSDDLLSLFDSFSDSPDFLWNEGMRQELCTTVTSKSKETIEKLRIDVNEQFDDLELFEVTYSHTNFKLNFRGVYLEAALQDLQWEIPTSRKKFVVSIIDYLCIGNDCGTEKECALTFLLYAYSTLFDEVVEVLSTSEILEKLAYVVGYKLQSFESIQACLVCISEISESMLEKRKLDLSPVFWSSMFKFLAKNRFSPKLNLAALQLCFTLCQRNKATSCDTIIGIEGHKFLGETLVHVDNERRKMAAQESEDLLTIPMADDIREILDGENKVLMLFIGLVVSHQGEILEDLKHIADSNHLKAAQASFNEITNEDLDGIRNSARNIFDVFHLINIEAFKTPSKILFGNSSNNGHFELMNALISKKVTDWDEEVSENKLQKSIFCETDTEGSCCK